MRCDRRDGGNLDGFLRSGEMHQRMGHLSASFIAFWWTVVLSGADGPLVLADCPAQEAVPLF
jgi:hypothetical protein